MNLNKKKLLASKALKVGKGRIVFNPEALSEIKEAITKQDIILLKEEGMISIKPVKGRRKTESRKTKRGPGKTKKKINKRNQIYVKITRKLRAYVKELKNQGEISIELYRDLRKKIKTRTFKSKASLKEYLENFKREGLLKAKSKEKSSSEKQKPKIKKESKLKKDKEKAKWNTQEN